MFKQEADGLDPFVDDEHVDAPEKEEAERIAEQRDAEKRRGPRCGRSGPEDGEDLVDGGAADPRLDAKPAARDKRAQQARARSRPSVPNDARQKTGNGIP